MNFLDQIQQDQDAAKSDLNSMLNQKAFDLLDSYAAGPEIEVVTFDEDEAALTEEDLDEMTQEEFEAIDEEQLDELSYDTLKSYVTKASNQYVSTMGDNKKRKNLTVNQKTKMQDRLKNIHVAVAHANKLTKEDVEEFEAIDEEQLDEGEVFNPGKNVWTSHTNKSLKGKIVSKDDNNEDHYIVKHADGNHSVNQHYIHSKEERAKQAAAWQRFAVPMPKKANEEFDVNEEQLDEGLGNLGGLSKHLLKTVTGSVYSGRSAGEHSEVESLPIKNKSAHRAALNKALDDGHVPVVYVNGKIHSAGHSTGNSYGRTEFNIHDADKQKEQKETIYPKPRRYGGKMHYSDPYHTSNPRYSKGDALDQLTPGHEASFYKENKVEVKVVKADKVRQKVRADRHANAPATQDNYVKTKPGDKNTSMYIDGKSKTSTTSAGDNLKAIKDAAALRLATKKLGGDSASANKKAMDLHSELGKHLAAGKHKEAIQTAHALADHIRNQGLTTHADKIKDYADTLKGLKDSWRGKEYSHKKLAQMRGEINESEELVQALELMLTEMLDTNEAVVPGSVKKDKDGNVLTFKSVGDGGKKLVKDRETGKMYDPEAEFDKLFPKKK